MNLLRLSSLFDSQPPFLEASEDLGVELRQRVSLLMKKWDPDKAKELADWMTKNFTFGASRTPQGQKKLKGDLAWLHRLLFVAATPLKGDTPEWRKSQETELKNRWGFVEDNIDGLADFTRGGKNKKTIPAEMKAGGNTYVNQVGFDEAKLKKWVSHFEKLWGGLKGWRRKALDGGLTVVLATPKEFHGTAAGKYKSDKDQMLVRATPKILKRTGGSYGAPDYVLIHELAHRYERKHGAKYDFDRPEWQVTKYARKDGESFSELFAMGYFRPTNAQMVMSQDQANKVLDRFETLMGGKKTEGVIRFRDMVRHAVFDEDIGHLHLMSKKKKLKKAKVTGTDGDVPEAQGAEDKPGAGPVDNRRAKSIPF